MKRLFLTFFVVFALFCPISLGQNTISIEFDASFHGNAVSSVSGGSNNQLDISTMQPGDKIYILLTMDTLNFRLAGFEYALTFSPDWVHLNGTNGEWHAAGPFFENCFSSTKLPFDNYGSPTSDTVDNSLGKVKMGYFQREPSQYVLRDLTASEKVLGKVIFSLGADPSLGTPIVTTDTPVFTLDGTTPPVFVNGRTRVEEAIAVGQNTLFLQGERPPFNNPPVVTLASVPSKGFDNTEIVFSAEATDVDGDAVTISWDFGDGSPILFGSSAIYSYASDFASPENRVELFDVIITATDSKGLTNTTSQQAQIIIEHIVDIPDPHFKAAVLAIFDANKDGILGAQEAYDEMYLNKLDVSNLGISDLTGVEYMSALNAFVCANNQLTTLPLNTQGSFFHLDCSNNQITMLPNFSDWPNLRYFNCSYNQLTQIDLSGIEKDLTELHCSHNQLTSFPYFDDLQLYHRLEVLNLQNNQIPYMGEVFMLDALKVLDLSYNQLTSVRDLSNNIHLEYLDLSHNLLHTPPSALNSYPRLPMGGSLNVVKLFGNSFGLDDCTELEAIRTLNLGFCQLNPQADQTTLDCLSESNLPPTIDQINYPTNVSQGLVYEFNVLVSDPEGDETSYHWDFGDGTPPKTGPKAWHVFQQPGSFPISLTVIDIMGNTVQQSDTVQVAASSTHPPRHFLPGEMGSWVGPELIEVEQYKKIISSDDSVYDLDLHDVSVEIDYGNGQTRTEVMVPYEPIRGRYSLDAIDFFSYVNTGTFVRKLLYTDITGAQGVFEVPYKVLPSTNLPPTIDNFNIPSTSGSSVNFSLSASDPNGDPLTITWYFGDGTTSTEWAPAHVYSGEGIFTVKAVVLDVRQAMTMVSQSIDIQLQPLVISGPSALSVDESKELGQLYEIDDPDGFLNSVVLLPTPDGASIRYVGTSGGLKRYSLEWVTRYGDSGYYSLQIEASTNAGDKVHHAVGVTVNQLIEPNQTTHINVLNQVLDLQSTMSAYPLDIYNSRGSRASEYRNYFINQSLPNLETWIFNSDCGNGIALCQEMRAFVDNGVLDGDSRNDKMVSGTPEKTYVFDVLTQIQGVLETQGSEIGCGGASSSPPVIQGPTSLTVTANTSISQAYTISDPDNDLDQIQTLNLPPGATFTNDTFDWMPTETEVGTQVFTIRASDIQANITELEVTVTVQPESTGGSTMYVQSIMLSVSAAGGPNYNGKAAITVMDNQGNHVAGVTLTGTFSGSLNESVAGITNSSGIATFITTGKKKLPLSLGFCVDSLTHGSLTYDPGSNTVTCQSGTF